MNFLGLPVSPIPPSFVHPHWLQKFPQYHLQKVGWLVGWKVPLLRELYITDISSLYVPRLARLSPMIWTRTSQDMIGICGIANFLEGNVSGKFGKKCLSKIIFENSTVSKRANINHNVKQNDLDTLVSCWFDAWGRFHNSFSTSTGQDFSLIIWRLSNVLSP